VGELATLLPAGGLGAVGAGGALLGVVIYLLNANRVDRREYQEAIDRAEARADAAEARLRAAESRMDGVQQALDEARTARRAAEDKAALAERELGRYQAGGAL
jgi:chromosome segregation ATPase